MNNYPCKDCIVLPVCSEICDNLYRLQTPDIFDDLIIYTEIIEGKYCPDCGNDKGFMVIGGATYTTVCSKCASTFTLSTHIASIVGLSKWTVTRHWQKGGLFAEDNELVKLMTFSEFIKGIK
jgi:hypothetical protein